MATISASADVVGARPARRWSPPALAGMVLGLSLGMTWQLWHGAERAAEQARRAAFDARADDALHQLRQRLQGYVQVLRGVQALFASSESVTRGEFADFVFAHDLDHELPGVQAITYLEQVQGAELAAYEARERAGSPGSPGRPDYRVFPAGPREQYAPIRYIEPDRGANARLPGCDGLFDPTRRRVFEQARDSGQPALSEPLALLQDGAWPARGFVLVVPVYRNGQARQDVAQRRAALQGWVSAPFRLDDVLAGLDAARVGGLGLSLAPSAEPLGDQGSADGAPERRTTVRAFEINGRTWRLFISGPAGAGTDAAARGVTPLSVALFGLAVTLALTLMTWLLARSMVAARSALGRTRILARELDQQRDDALALAGTAHRAQAMTATILDATIDGILVERQGCILALNQRLRAMWGVPDRLDLNSGDAALAGHMAAQLADQAAFLRSRSMAHGQDRGAPALLLSLHDGRVFEQACSPVALGRGEARLWSYRDVTQREQIEQRERGHRHVLELLARGAPLPAILEAVVLGVEAAHPDMRCAIMLVRDGGYLVTGAAPSLPDYYRDAIDGVRIGPVTGACAAAVFLGRRVMVEDVRSHPGWAGMRMQVERAGLLSCWSEPIRGSSGRVLGTFAIYHASVQHPSPAHLMLIEQAAQLAGIALEQAEAAQAVRIGQERFRKLYENAPVALWEQDWSQARAAWEALRGGGVADPAAWLREHPAELARLAALVRIADVNRAALAQVGAPTPDLERLRLAQVFGGSGAAVFADAMEALAAGASTFACEATFLRVDGEERHNEVTLLMMPGHAGTLDRLIVSTLDITERKRLDAELVQLACTDFLTGLPNRREFMARLEQELARLQRHTGDCAALLMLDIDHFKSVNDGHGHAVGDAVLRHMAGLMRESQRRIDVLGRVGGEEFAVLLPGAALEAAANYAERLRENVAATPLWEDGRAITITVSIGIACLAATDTKVDAALVRADQALYQAKAAGRNRVCRQVGPDA